MVVARDRYVAEDAAQRVRVHYDVLPAVVGVEAARAAEHLVHEEAPGNVGAYLEQHLGDAPGQIAAAPHVLELDLDIERSACMPMEGKGILARWDAEEHRLKVHASTQTSTGLRAALAAKLGLSLSAVEVVAPDVGGGFGSKLQVYGEEVISLLVARRLGKPVKWTETRSENMVGSLLDVLNVDPALGSRRSAAGQAK
mgnify:CR=1 FL=1